MGPYVQYQGGPLVTSDSVTFSNTGANGNVIVDAVDYVLDADSDSDGIPDAWERQYFGDISSQSGGGDYDHDGVTNLQEYLNHTDPTDPAPSILLTAPAGATLQP